MTDLEDRIHRLEARCAVADLVYRYAQLIRLDRSEEIPELFLPDGTFEVREGHPNQLYHKVRGLYRSRGEIYDHLAQNKGKPHPVPLIRNLLIHVVGSTATANCVMDAKIYGSEHAIQGEYVDTFQLVDSQWYFSSRIFTIYLAGQGLREAGRQLQ